MTRLGSHAAGASVIVPSLSIVPCNVSDVPSLTSTLLPQAMVTSSKVLLPQTVSIRPPQVVASVPPEIAVSESSTTEPFP